jgi:hypothetical protein
VFVNTALAKSSFCTVYELHGAPGELGFSGEIPLWANLTKLLVASGNKTRRTQNMITCGKCVTMKWAMKRLFAII